MAHRPMASLPIEVSGVTGPVSDVNVSIFITHTWDADLTIGLRGPDSTAVELSSSNGSSGDNYGVDCPAGANDTTFDDEAIEFGHVRYGAICRLVPTRAGAVRLRREGGRRHQWHVGALRLGRLGQDAGTIECATVSISTAHGTDGGGMPGGSGTHVFGDFDGDGSSDIAVFRPSNGRWYVNGQPVRRSRVRAGTFLCRATTMWTTLPTSRCTAHRRIAGTGKVEPPSSGGSQAISRHRATSMATA